MGDFDRNTSSAGEKPADTKKMVIVVALGVVLIGLVAMQMMKHGGGPQVAAGAPVADGVALPPPVVAEEISPDALAHMTADLQNDPTSKLLRQESRGDDSLNAVPNNPFSMDGTWLATLIRPGRTTPVQAVQPTQEPVRQANPTPLAAGTALRAEDYKLASIVNGNMAIINGKIVKTNDIVGKAKVLQIRDDAVVLQSFDSPTGPTIEISMSTRLTNGN